MVERFDVKTPNDMRVVHRANGEFFLRRSPLDVFTGCEGGKVDAYTLPLFLSCRDAQWKKWKAKEKEMNASTPNASAADEFMKESSRWHLFLRPTGIIERVTAVCIHSPDVDSSEPWQLSFFLCSFTVTRTNNDTPVNGARLSDSRPNVIDTNKPRAFQISKQKQHATTLNPITPHSRLFFPILVVTAQL